MLCQVPIIVNGFMTKMMLHVLLKKKTVYLFDYHLLQITGDANEDQVILSVETYVGCPNLLLMASREHNRIITDGECTNPCRALQVH